MSTKSNKFEFYSTHSNEYKFVVRSACDIANAFGNKLLMSEKPSYVSRQQ